MLLLEILSDLVKIDDILLIIKNDGATSEIRSNSLSIRQKEKWITIGDNDGPAHMQKKYMTTWIKNILLKFNFKKKTCLKKTSRKIILLILFSSYLSQFVV